MRLVELRTNVGVKVKVKEKGISSPFDNSDIPSLITPASPLLYGLGSSRYRAIKRKQWLRRHFICAPKPSIWSVVHLVGRSIHWRLHTARALSNVFIVTPITTKALIDSGYVINVEKSTERVFRDEEYKAVGATLVPEGTWPSAPKDHIIVGLKELPQDDGKPVLHQLAGFQADPGPLTSSPGT